MVCVLLDYVNKLSRQQVVFNKQYITDRQLKSITIKHVNLSYDRMSFKRCDPSISLKFLISGQPNRHYSKKDDNKVAACCKDVSQTEGKKVEPWPKHDAQALPPWRCECSREPQPPNYDPYRIKVPDVVVPPLPPSKVKVSVAIISCPI